MALAALMFAPAPASASPGLSQDPGRLYVEARAAAINGEHARAAELLADLAEADPGQADLARSALEEALGAGQFDLALKLAHGMSAAKLPIDGRLLIVADEVMHRRVNQALPWLVTSNGNGNLSFLVPFISAWDAADRGDATAALSAINSIPANSVLAPMRNEEEALILLKFRRTAEAEPFARRAIGSAGGRETHVRLALADGFLAAGDKARALAMIDGMRSGAAEARQRIAAGKASGEGIDNLNEALSAILTSFGADLARMQQSAPPIGLVQVARYANPRNSSATALLALLFEAQNRDSDALALLRSVPADDPLIGSIRDVQVRILTDQKQLDQAYAVAAAAAASRTAALGDYSRLGDVLEAMNRHDAAADAYGRAVALASAQGLKSELWPLLLLRASALEQGNRWPEAKQALQQALAIAPDEPLLLNFLGYAKLERGEDMDSAEAMIRKASELAPDDASITDSLGWAQYKRGKIDEAIDTLQRAAEKDPEQAEIQEHLGDALYKSGRRMEARFAWNAALVTAEDKIATRVKEKLATGLTTADAAP